MGESLAYTREEAIALLLERLSPPQADELRKVLDGDPGVSERTRWYWEAKISDWMQE